MIRCNGPKGTGICVLDMDSQQDRGGQIVCDIAEDVGFRRDDVLTNCEFAFDHCREELFKLMQENPDAPMVDSEIVADDGHNAG